MGRKVVFLDACVLYPYSVRDILLQFAVDGFFRAKWSFKVEEEFVRNVEKNQPSLKGKLGRTVQFMRLAIPDFSAECAETVLTDVSESMTDKKDMEILAAAISSSCNYLVTYNLKDFDIAFALGRGVQVIHPDEFILVLLEANPLRAQKSFHNTVSRFKNPPRSEKEYCMALRKNNLNKAIDYLEALLGI